MEIATIKAVLDACYQAQRIRAMLPTLPDGVTPSYIHFFDLIETMEQKYPISATGWVFHAPA